MSLKIRNSRFLIILYERVNLTETNPFLSAQMAVLSSFLQVFMVLGM
jgi:hypothetical protein